VSALEVAVGEGCKAESVGKPTRAFFEVCLRDLGVGKGFADDGQIGPGEVAVVGDDIEADLGDGALELGLQRVLGEVPDIPPISCTLLIILLRQSRQGNIAQETNRELELPHRTRYTSRLWSLLTPS